jgi:hypothetical protein
MMSADLKDNTAKATRVCGFWKIQSDEPEGQSVF